MTTQDYRMIAAVLKDYRVQHKNEPQVRAVTDEIILALANKFAAADEAFMRHNTFLRDSGIPER